MLMGRKAGMMKWRNIALAFWMETISVWRSYRWPVEAVKAAVARHPEVRIEWVPLPIGYRSFVEHGNSLLPQVLETLYTLDGWILGPIGHMAYPKDPNCVNPHPILRRNYDLVSNIRPAKAYPGVSCINPKTDLIIVRENNEGLPAGPEYV